MNVIVFYKDSRDRDYSVDSGCSEGVLCIVVAVSGGTGGISGDCLRHYCPLIIVPPLLRTGVGGGHVSALVLVHHQRGHQLRVRLCHHARARPQVSGSNG